jgi:hypothetical protein
MKDTWTPMEERGAGGEPLYRDEKGYVRMELLPERIRVRIPPLGATDEQGEEAIVQARLFQPGGPFVWYVIEFDGDDTCFGYVVDTAVPDWSEYGHFSLSELEAAPAIVGRGRVALPVERDVLFEPTPLSEVEGY